MEQIFLASGFPKEILSAIIMLYKDTKAMVCSLDSNTNFFDIVTGVLQREYIETISFHNLPRLCTTNINTFNESVGMSFQQMDLPSYDTYQLSSLLRSLGEPSPRTDVMLIVLSWGGVSPSYRLCMYYFLSIYIFITHFRVVLSFQPRLNHNRKKIVFH